MPYKVSVYGLSDIGLVRQNNEDVWAQLPEDSFFVLADGMGGHQAGEIAAREAVDHLCEIFKKTKESHATFSLQEAQAFIFESIQQVNEFVYHLGHNYSDFKGMGTTLCCVWVREDGIIYGNVGDSRIYRLREKKLEQLTQDDSLLRELINSGQINEEQAGNFLYKNIITKAIGTESSLEPTVYTNSLIAGDTILMCSDGLTDLLTRDEICQVMIHSKESDIARYLVKAAKLRGGYDNITVVVIKIQEKT